MQEGLKIANRLEGILTKYLDCNWSNFGVKANNDLLRYDWKSPINFALGVSYERNRYLKNDIDLFLGNTLMYNSIEDVIDTTIKEELENINEEETTEKELQEIREKGYKKGLEIANKIIDELEKLLK